MQKNMIKMCIRQILYKYTCDIRVKKSNKLLDLINLDGNKFDDEKQMKYYG